MSNKFVSILKTIGRDFKKGLDFLLPFAASTGAVAVSLFAPQLGPLYNQTVSAVLTAEQSASAIASAGGTMTGQEKAAAVFKLAGPLIKQVLADAGKDSSDAGVQKYIDSVVLILDTTPALPAQQPA